jgi:DNA-binding MarR family transcriptional regulator
MRYNYSESFGFALGRAAGVMKNRFHMALRGLDVTPDQTVAILRLSADQGISPTILAEAIAKDKPNTVRIIGKLHQKGLVSLRESASDKRSYWVYLTKKGVALQEGLIPIAESLKEQALKGFDQEEIDQFNQLLKKMHKNLC